MNVVERVKNFFQKPERKVFILIALIGTFYSPLASLDFLNFDDPGYVTKNPQVLKGLTWDGIAWAFTSNNEGHWHPLTWISHMIDVSLFGLDPALHHVVNLIFFLCSLVFLYLTLIELIGKEAERWIFLGVAMFAIHPMRLESVAWISERKDVMSFCFGMLSLLLWQKKARCASLIAFAFSLLSKPTFVSLPILLMLIDQVKRPETKLVKNLQSKLGFLILAISSSMIVITTQSRTGALHSLTLIERFEKTIYSLSIYAAKFFAPLHTSIFYPNTSHSVAMLLLSATILIAITYTLFRTRFKQPKAWLGWQWFTISSIPISGFIYIGGQSYADRWSLLPHVGLLIIVISLLSHKKFTLNFGILTAGIIFSLAFATWQTIPTWKNTETIFKHALEVTPNNFMAHTNLGAFYEQKGESAKADYHFEKAIEQNPTYAEALNNWGLVLARRGKLEEAKQSFQNALKSDPNLKTAKENLNLATYLLNKNQTAH